MFAGGRLRLFLVWVAAYLLSYFYRSANAVIASDLRDELGLDAEQLGLMTSLFFLTFAVVQIPLGGALDRWGSRRVIPVMLLAGAAGSALFGLGGGFLPLAAGRALLGVGFAGVLMGSLKAFAAWFPPGRFATVSGLFVAVGSAGALVAGTPLALLAGSFGWRAVFVGGAAVVLAAAAAIVLLTKDAPAPAASAQPRVEGAGASRVDANAEPAAGLIGVMRDHVFWRISFVNLGLVGSVLAVQGLWAGPYLGDVYGLAPVPVGNLLIALGVGVVVGNAATGWMADTLGRFLTVLVLGALSLAANLVLAAAPAGMPQAVLGVVYVALGFSGALVAVLMAHAREVAPPSTLGRAITFVNFFGIGGAMALQWLMGAIVETGASVQGYGAAAYRPAFLMLAALAAVSTLLYLPVAGGKRSPSRDSTSARPSASSSRERPPASRATSSSSSRSA